MSKTTLIKLPPTYDKTDYPYSSGTVLQRYDYHSTLYECSKEPVDYDSALGNPKYWTDITGYGGAGDQAQLDTLSVDPANDTSQTVAASSYSVKVLHDLVDTITAPDATQLSDATDSQSSETIATSKAVKTAISLADNSSSIPAGFICAFYGSRAEVKDSSGNSYYCPVDPVYGFTYVKWAICDYSAQTINGFTVPTLNDKFPRCAVKEDAHFTDIGTTGGSENHTHEGTINECTLTSNQWGSHCHEYLKNADKYSYYTVTGTATYSSVDTSKEGTLEYNTGGSVAHTHTFSYGTIYSYNASCPPYRQLFYICKLPDAPTEE